MAACIVKKARLLRIIAVLRLEANPSCVPLKLLGDVLAEVLYPLLLVNAVGHTAAKTLAYAQ